MMFFFRSLLSQAASKLRIHGVCMSCIWLPSAKVRLTSVQVALPSHQSPSDGDVISDQDYEMPIILIQKQNVLMAIYQPTATRMLDPIHFEILLV